MMELVFDILLMSLAGAVFTSVILILKSVISVKLSAVALRALWIIVLFLMVFPFWRIFPEMPEKLNKDDEKIPFEIVYSPQNENGKDGITDIPKVSADAFRIISHIWVFGAAVFYMLAQISYASFLLRKKKHSEVVENGAVFERVKQELGIKRKIVLRKADDDESPMLTGLIFPVVYVPECVIGSDSALVMVLRHELMHYKHYDLFFKQAALVVNALHWFNPFAYIATKEYGKACEYYCDMAVTEHLGDSDKKLYMNTILNLAQAKKG